MQAVELKLSMFSRCARISIQPANGPPSVSPTVGYDSFNRTRYTLSRMSGVDQEMVSSMEREERGYEVQEEKSWFRLMRWGAGRTGAPVGKQIRPLLSYVATRCSLLEIPITTSRTSRSTKKVANMKASIQEIHQTRTSWHVGTGPASRKGSVTIACPTTLK